MIIETAGACAVNADDTFADIAAIVSKRRPLLIAWTDGRGTQHDVLFTLLPLRIGPIQGGLLHGGGELFVSVMRVGAWGFRLERTGPLHQNYVAEKLGVSEGPTAEAMAALISGVIEHLNKGEQQS